MLVDTLEKNQRNLRISIPKKEEEVTVSAGTFIRELDFFKQGFQSQILDKIILETQEQAYKIDETVFNVFNENLMKFKNFFKKNIKPKIYNIYKRRTQKCNLFMLL